MSDHESAVINVKQRLLTIALNSISVYTGKVWSGKCLPCSLKGYSQALEKKHIDPDVPCDGGDAPANLLCQFYSQFMPSTSCFNDNG